MKRIGILGAGTWGMALARMLTVSGNDVLVWSAIEKEIDSLSTTRKHPNLPQMKIPDELRFTKSIEEVCKDKDILLFAVPSVFVRSTAAKARPYVADGQIIVDVAKGIEPDTLYTMTEILADELGKEGGPKGVRLVALSGPTHAEEVAIDLPTTIVSASKDMEAAAYVQEVFTNNVMRVYTNEDIKGVELSGAMKNVVMFLNLSNDPIIERILTPRCALTAAEYLAFTHGYHVLVVMTDMTSYCEAVREFSSSKGEIPSRKGFPAYLYSDLASLYERAGMIAGKKGSVTQVPILTMPNDDITHPIPDLTGYITEGQIVLDRNMDQSGVYPPINILSSLSRLMKDGIGKGFTRDDHPGLSNQLFAAYSKVQDARSLASVIGEDELSPLDQQYLKFGRAFEQYFVRQGQQEDRSLEQTLELGWTLLSILPRGELDRVSDQELDAHYRQGAFEALTAEERGQ